MDSKVDRHGSRSRMLVLIAVAAGSCWPLFACRGDFQRLFLFQDEWDQLRQIDQQGVWRWAVSIFGENFMPLGKLVWAWTLRASGGSYFALIVGVWATHALNVLLLGTLLARRGCGTAAAVLAAVLFGYSATMVETMAWAIQWSNVLPFTFFLIALLRLERFTDESAATLADYVILMLLLMASALSFVRGMFCGLAVAGTVLLPGLWPLGGRRRLALGAAVALPAVIVLVGMMLGGFGAAQGHRYTWETLGLSGLFALHTYAHNPIATWWSGNLLAPGALAGFALVKTGILAGGLCWSPRALRPVLWTLVGFELINDMALGLGRFHTGLATAASSRYQYTSLVALLPFVGVLFSRGLDALERWANWRLVVGIMVPMAAGLAVTWSWPATMRDWSGWRGGDLRAALAKPREEAPTKLPFLDWITYDEAHALMQRHQLH